MLREYLASFPMKTLYSNKSYKSDQLEISPYNINALENRVVVRIEYIIGE